MTELSLNLPVVGEKDTTAEPKVTTAFTEIQTVINGKIDTNNLESHKALIQNNNSYAAEKAVSKAEFEAAGGVEFSATRVAFVTGLPSAGLEIGGIKISISSGGGAMIPPGQKVKATAAATVSVLLL